jgi:hypothetical protein
MSKSKTPAAGKAAGAKAAGAIGHREIACSPKATENQRRIARYSVDEASLVHDIEVVETPRRCK